MHLTTPEASTVVRAAISEVATANGGSVRGVELRDLGLTSRQVDHLVATGFLHRVRRDHFLVGHRAPSIRGDRHSKVMQGGDGALLSSLAAIDEWGFLPWTTRIVDIVVPKERRPITGARLRVRPRLVTAGGTKLGRTPILTPEFAVLDACDHVDGSSIRRIIREGRFREVLSMERLDRAAATSLRGVRALRDALALHSLGDNGHNSLFEQSVDGYLPPDVIEGSVANADIFVGGEGMGVDRVWFEERICAEYDGKPHDAPDQMRLDRIRTAALVVDGWDLHRIHWRAFDRDPSAAVAPLVCAVRNARMRATLDDLHVGGGDRRG